jgi:anti-sigma regulatory factor (Ser/Thr protein kinase)
VARSTSGGRPADSTDEAIEGLQRSIAARRRALSAQARADDARERARIGSLGLEPPVGPLDGERSPDAAVSLALSPGATAPVRARAALRALAGDVNGEQFDLLALVVSELVTNSFLHGCAGPEDRITMQVAVYPHTVHGEVSDSGPGFTLPDPPRSRESGGLGLVIVERATKRWGTSHDGRRVWFELNRDAQFGR